MIALTAEEIATITGAVSLSPQAEQAIADGPVVVDSRKAGAGSLFAAIVGEHVDGHDYIDAAAKAGATVAITSRQVPDSPIPLVVVEDVPSALGALAREVLARLRARHDVRVVAVTGSVGKTSTKDLLATTLAPLGNVIAPVGSFNNEIGLPLTVLRADETTRVLALEMGADGPGNITYLTSIAPPDVAIVLVVGHAHLGGFGSVDGIAQAKSELVRGLRTGGVAVLNGDDPRVAAMAAVSAGERVVYFGRDERYEVFGHEVTSDERGHLQLSVSVGEDTERIETSLTGKHHMTNVLAAVAASLSLGLSLADIAASMKSAGPASPHRMQVTRTTELTVIDDSYNANPDSMSAGLTALAQLAAEARTVAGARTVAVLGEMRELGDASAESHRQIGELCGELAIDEIIVVAEGAREIAAGARAANKTIVHLCQEVDEAEELLPTVLRRGDFVLVKASNGAGLMTLADRLAAGELAPTSEVAQ